MLTLIAGVVPILLALQNVGRNRRGFRWEFSDLESSGAVFNAAFIWAEQRAAHPILPLHLFKIASSLFRCSVRVLLPPQCLV